MCTAISFVTKNHYFGRNLDLEYTYNETVTITPRLYPLHFRYEKDINDHYALIGMATVERNYPLYYDATNEKGLSIAALNFPGNAVYRQPKKGFLNIAPFEFIPWVLCQCDNVSEASLLLKKTNITNTDFSSKFPVSPLHWMISDSKESIVAEPVSSGLRIYQNPVGVLTNNPPFDFHMYNLSNYLNLTREEPINRLCSDLDLKPYSRGTGSIGLPGDLSSASRFIRAAFTKLNSICDASESASISQFFHILGSVAQQRGCVLVGEKFEKTVYSSCCNTNTGVYYYTTYENSQITAVNMHHQPLDSCALSSFPLISGQQILHQN